MYHVRLKGSHYASGYKWGELLYKRGVSLEHCPTFTPDDNMRSFARQCKEEYARYFPQLLEEIQGIADGQRLPAQILETILFSMYCLRYDNHCTCLAISNESEILFARNSDFLVSIEKLYMNCLYKLNGGYAFNGNTTAYVEMEDGVNEHGLAAGLCFVYPKVIKPGFNAGMLIRFILERCRTVAEAITAVQNLPIASAQTISLADKSGELAVLECNSEKLSIIRPELSRDYVAAANCFTSPDMLEYRNTEIDDWQAEERYKTAQKALSTKPESASVDFLKGILGGRYGFMCQYDRKKNADTVWSVIYDLKRKQIWRAEGNPSRKAYKEDKRMSLL